MISLWVKNRQKNLKTPQENCFRRYKPDKKKCFDTFGFRIPIIPSRQKNLILPTEESIILSKYIVSSIPLKPKKFLSKVNRHNNSCCTQENKNFSVRSQFLCHYLADKKFTNQIKLILIQISNHIYI